MKKYDKIIWNAEYEIIHRLPVDGVFLANGDDTQKGTSIISIRVETKNLEKK